jgi:hypothetical protein
MTIRFESSRVEHVYLTRSKDPRKKAFYDELDSVLAAISLDPYFVIQAGVPFDNPEKARGKPEKLKHLPGYYSRHILKGQDRLVYKPTSPSSIDVKSFIGHYIGSKASDLDFLDEAFSIDNLK